MTVWLYDCMIVWLYDCMIVWVYDCMIVWLCDCMILWLYDCMIVFIVWLWLYDFMIVWLCDFMIVWLYDFMIVWFYDCMIVKRVRTRIASKWIRNHSGCGGRLESESKQILAKPLVFFLFSLPRHPLWCLIIWKQNEFGHELLPNGSEIRVDDEEGWKNHLSYNWK